MTGRIRPDGRHVDLDAAALAVLETAGPDAPVYVQDGTGEVAIGQLVLVPVRNRRGRVSYEHELWLCWALAPGPCAVRLRSTP